MGLLAPPGGLCIMDFMMRTEGTSAISHTMEMLSLSAGFFCALAGWWLGQRHNLSIGARVGWSLFLFVCGIPGLLTFLSVQEWPAREKCPGCGKLRAVDREECEHCGAKFHASEPNGTEVFETLEKF